MEVIPGSSIIIFTNRFVIFAPCWDLGGTKTPLASGDQEGYKGNSWGAGVEYQENCFEQNTLKRYSFGKPEHIDPTHSEADPPVRI